MRVSVKVLGLNKSEVHLDNGTVVFFSYQTPVAAVHEGTLYVTTRSYSRTTSKHVSQWDPPPHRDTKLATEEFLATLIPRVVMEENSEDIRKSLGILQTALVPHMGILPNLVFQKIAETLQHLSTEENEN